MKSSRGKKGFTRRSLGGTGAVPILLIQTGVLDLDDSEPRRSAGPGEAAKERRDDFGPRACYQHNAN